MISVCMATYNGSKYLELQLRSILEQLAVNDELIVVDDGSKDDTVRLLQDQNDPRIKLTINPQNLGVVRTFEKALSKSQGEIIFLADQDDVWYPHKVASIRKSFEDHPEATIVLSDARIVDGEGRQIRDSWTRSLNFNPGLVANLWKNRYLGCVMAFRREILKVCLPFPADIPMHDMWIGCLNHFCGATVLLNEPLMDYRKHGTNVTTGRHGTLKQMLTWRWKLAKNLLVRRASLSKAKLT